MDALEDGFLTKLRFTVEEQLDNPGLSADTICQPLGMGPTTLPNKLTALTGMSICRYVRALRLRKVWTLLTTTTLNIWEVAYAVVLTTSRSYSRAVF